MGVECVNWRINTLKEPSPEVKPAIHCEWGTIGFTIVGLGCGLLWGNTVFNCADNPLFIEAFRLIILNKPSSDKCSFFTKLDKTNLNNS